ncbi:MAG: NifB/NifX family molybdenum-iron cluster-binding protein [Bacillota bacterium]
MKVAVAAQGETLDSPVDMRFGRAPFFLVVDSETLDYEVIANPAVQAPGGAGIQTAQLLARSGVGAVVAGNVGPNAMSALRAAGVEVYAARGGTVRENVQAFLRRELVPLADATVASHFGVGAWSGSGGGAPGGPGTGRGRGGWGRGGGAGGGMGQGGAGGGMGHGGGMGRGRGGCR